jgi:alkaline phosphatase
MKRLTLSVCASILSVIIIQYVAAAQPTVPRNIIVMIGDGMGVGQLTVMKTLLGDIALDDFPVGGLAATQAIDRFVTESAAAGTTLSTGERSTHGRIAQRPDGTPLTTLLEAARARGRATGVVATSSVTHATPAAFLTHAANRNMEFDIAAGIATSGADVIIGGGQRFFLPEGDGGDREDGRNLVREMQAAGYAYITAPDLPDPSSDKLLYLLTSKALPPAAERDYTLRDLTRIALTRLSRQPDCFVLMIEGSQIDWAGHDNNFEALKAELRDFEGAIAAAADFARGEGETLLLVTADHETGGLAVTGNAPDGSDMVGSWTSLDHTANMVPVFAIGPAAERFGGLSHLIEIGRTLHDLLR